MNNVEIIDKLNENKCLSFSEWEQLLETFTEEDAKYAADIAREIAVSKFGKKIFFRGIVEFTNYCKNDCYYCGIRCSNKNAVRYRLSKEDILSCCEEGYKYGYRTFVLQGGEDRHYTDDMIVDIVSEIHQRFPDCAITLSIGEKERESYQRFFDAGARRYLLRHETANEEHYRKLHPEKLSLKHRMNCLKDLKEIGYQTGCGCMVGSPYQTISDLCEDMIYMSEFKPQMIGIGPFIPHKDTPFRDFESGSVEMTLFLLSLCRIMLPDVLLPATTALGTAKSDGRKLGVLCGANVIMPNLSPIAVRKNYLLYDNKAISGEDAGENLRVLQDHMSEIGYEIVVDRGDYRG
ncbi:MAG: [FeFe] hydrogenase H-cluster radical SAM maturase HydE [Intestinibacter sp.]|uniref:[FeFe] hydrogenase H-cluster radical SAM maturase HydE n=1 Tax=Intestinibacter sp. TaxID=1965304 RepID=UPI002A825231|nr:[FeFe] hydrogenase H-cluster radical SAM maturase HydE [Intestinibacter sp.]MDY4574488.1 [FeFe] hydrogenase H-cluster radical SAM maturase HydE [Intestinibacter sp.]